MSASAVPRRISSLITHHTAAERSPPNSAAFAVLDDVVEVELLFFFLLPASAALGRLGLLLQRIQPRHGLVEQRVAVGDLVRRARQDVAGHGDVRSQRR